MNSFWLHPSLLLLAGAVVLPLLPQRLRPFWLLLVPVAVLVNVLSLREGVFAEVSFLEWKLVFGRVDSLSLVFAIIMALMCLIGSLYSLKVKETGQHIAGWTYVAGSLGVILAGDLLVVFLFWELMALSSVFLIWARRTTTSLAAGYRYLIIHTVGGLSLLAGIVLYGAATGGDFAFVPFHLENSSLALWLILAGFLLNAAVPPLHAWLPDAYPAATFNGSVFLSAFTTKTAVYALCRGFPGLEILVVVGVVMALYGVIYAFLANDSRQLLAYHIVSQVGFMVAGVGLGSELAINGAIAHAFAHILYKGLLFMGCGSVLHMTGETRFSHLGGLYRKMPWTMVFTLVGAVSISGVPLFSGFISKSMTISAGFDLHQYWAAYLLLLASVGTFVSINLKLMYFLFFGKQRASSEVWDKARDPGWNMQAAMAITSLLCLVIGCFPWLLYRLLPYAVSYQPYTAYHLSETIQILLFATAAFVILRPKLAPHVTRSVDLDWFYRVGGRGVLWLVSQPVQVVDRIWAGVHQSGGIANLMRSAFWIDRCDQRVIDGVVDGTAESVRRFGNRLRVFQRASLQQNLVLTFAVVAGLLAIFIVLS